MGNCLRSAVAQGKGKERRSKSIEEEEEGEKRHYVGKDKGSRTMIVLSKAELGRLLDKFDGNSEEMLRYVVEEMKVLQHVEEIESEDGTWKPSLDSIPE